MTTPLTPPPMTEAQFRECGIITGPNLVGNCGPRYRSHGTQTNVWEKDLHALVAARDTQWAARVAELERDAARYRWLRHGDNDEKVIQRGPVANDYVYLPRNAKLDEMIDAALSSEGKGAEG